MVLLALLDVGKKYIRNYWKKRVYSSPHGGLNAKFERMTIRVFSFFLVFISFNAIADVALETSVQKVEFVTNQEGITQVGHIPVEIVYAGDQLRYTIEFVNNGKQAIESGVIAIINPIPEDTKYVFGTAMGLDTLIEYSLDGQFFAPAEELFFAQDGLEEEVPPSEYRFIRWIYLLPLAPGEVRQVSFNIRIDETLSSNEEEPLEVQMEG